MCSLRGCGEASCEDNVDCRLRIDWAECLSGAQCTVSSAFIGTTGDAAKPFVGGVKRKISWARERIDGVV